MGFFDRFKKKEEEQKLAQRSTAKPVVAKKNAVITAPTTEKKTEKQPEQKKDAKPVTGKVDKIEKKEKIQIKGGTTEAYRVLLKPLITEKATTLSGLNKYVFAVDPSMNKVEVKKAIRSVYNVDPVAVNIANFHGKHVSSGRIHGKRKNWKKAVITLKQGDTIQVYEGV